MSSLLENIASMPQPQLLQQIYNHNQLPPAQNQAPVPPPAQPQLVAPAPSKHAIPKESMYKNHLQEYTQKKGLPLPLYQTFNEGTPHGPMFRSTVVVNGVSCTSLNVFPQRKAAEMDVARIALLNVVPHVKEEEENCSLDEGELLLCKAILKEYADKLNVENPNYKTEKTGGSRSVFVSSLTFNGKQFVGDQGRNKKESQQLAARAVILSILDSDASDAISKIIKSKRKVHCPAKGKVKNPCNTQDVGMPAGIQTESNVGTSASKGKELEVVVNDNMLKTATQESCTGSSSRLSAKPVSLVDASATPIVFVPANSEQLVVGSTSSKKRKRKTKQAAKKVGINAKVHVAAVPSSQATTSTDYSDRICAPNNCVQRPGSHNAVLSGT